MVTNIPLWHTWTRLEPNKTMKGKTVLASNVAKSYLDEIRRTIKEKNIEVKLVGFLANKDPSAVKYAESSEQVCVESGIQFELRRLNRESLEDAIIEANNDDSVHGIIVYYPVFGGGHDQYIQNCVNPYKDVEGLSHSFRFNMYHNIRYINGDQSLKNIIPVTPLAIIKILEYCKVYNPEATYGNQLCGKTVTIINRSEVNGRPLAALLANDGATVYSIDIEDTLEFNRGHIPSLRKHVVMDSDMTLEKALPISDVVITGVPKQNYRVNTDLLKDGAVAVNFSGWKNFEDNVREKCSIFVPSIGKLTTTMLQRNLLRLRFYQIDHQNKFDIQFAINLSK